MTPEIELQRRIAELEAKLESLTQEVRQHGQRSPLPPIFLARQTATGRQFQEIAVHTDEDDLVDLVTYDDGRKCVDDDTTEALIDLYEDEAVVMEVLEGDAARFVKLNNVIRWCKVVTINNCGRSFQAHRCDVNGDHEDTSEEILVYTGTPTEGCDVLGYCLNEGDVVPFISDGANNNFQVNPYKYVSFGYLCQGSKVVGDLSSIQFADYDFNLAATGTGGCETEGMSLLDTVGAVEWKGLRFTWYGQESVCFAKKLAFDEDNHPPAEADQQYYVPVAFDPTCGSDTVTVGSCVDVAIPKVSLKAWAKKGLKFTKCVDSGGASQDFTSEVIAGRGVKFTFGGSGHNVTVDVDLLGSTYVKLTDQSTCGLRVEVCTESKEVVTDVVCNEDGTLTVTKENVTVLAACE